MSVQSQPVQAAKPLPLNDRLQRLRDALSANLVERDEAARLALLAALAGEHLLLVGPPGTAKSLVARRLRHAFKDATYFERLLTRFTVPEELFGPLSIKGLEEDRYERLTTAYLPSASVAFLDEIFKANSAILNALLTLLNEREFDNGVRREQAPLIAVVGASNELPEGDELEALFDRFLIRLHVGPVSKQSFSKLLSLRGDLKVNVPAEIQLSQAELLDIQAKSTEVRIPDDVGKLLCDLREWCAAQEIAVSDRRWRKIVKLLQVSALTNLRVAVSIWDCWLLQHCLWETPEQRESLYAWYADRVGASAAMDPESLTGLVTLYEAQLKADRESRSQQRNKNGQLLFRNEYGKATIEKKGKKQKHRGEEPLFLAPPNAVFRDRYTRAERTNSGKGYTASELANLWLNVESRDLVFDQWKEREAFLADSANWLAEESDREPLLESTRHKPVYVSSTVSELKSLQAEVATYRRELEQHMASMRSEITSHLWVDSSFAEPAAASLNSTRDTVAKLADRVVKLIDGFEQLPVESASDPRAQK